MTAFDSGSDWDWDERLEVPLLTISQDGQRINLQLELGLEGSAHTLVAWHMHHDDVKQK
jgi:hypothetical protein